MFHTRTYQRCLRAQPGLIIALALMLTAVQAACGVGLIGGEGEGALLEEEDGFWAGTRDDDDLLGDERSAASAAAGQQRVTIRPGTTDNAELVEQLPVGRSESGASRRVVLRLRPDEIPKLREGDRLITPAEVQVTTRCDVGQVAPGCDYNPKVRARLILTGDPGDTTGGGGGSTAIASATQTCTRGEHHCMFVFRPSEAQVVLKGGDAPPCVAADRCFVNLVMWAWHPDARAGGQDKLLVGGNDGNYLANGRVEGDMARLMVVRERGITAADRAARQYTTGGDVTINTNANPVLIYSHRLKAPGHDLARGEQFLVEAKVSTAVNGRARFSTKLFLTKDPKATEGNGLDKISPGSIGEHNGFNCLPGASPCTTRKVAVFRVNEGIKGPVFVNLIAKSAVPGGGSAHVTVKRGDGWLRSVRYRAQLGE